MAFIVSKQAGNLSDVNGFYRVESHNLVVMGATDSYDVLSSTARTIPMTFDNAGNLTGCVLSLTFSSTQTTTMRSIVIALQENVAGTWTTRMTQTFASTYYDTFTRGISSNSLHLASAIPFTFSSPYTVDTTESKWRLAVSVTGGSGTMSLCRSSSSADTSFIYAAWCDTQVSFTNNDSVIFAHPIKIDMSCNFNAVNNSARPYCGLICTSLSPTNLYNFIVEEGAARTIQFSGVMGMGYRSGIQVGSSANPITYANRVTFQRNNNSQGTDNTIPAVAMFNDLVTDSTTTKSQAFFVDFHGEYPSLGYCTLTAQTNIGSDTLNIDTDMTTHWKAGDTVFIGSQVGASNTPEDKAYTISSITATTIVLTENIGTYARAKGAKVMLAEPETGIIFIRNRGADTTSCPLEFRNASTLHFEGVFLKGDTGTFYIRTGASTNYFYRLDAQYRSQWIIRNCYSHNAYFMVGNQLAVEKGVLLENLCSHRGGIYYNPVFPVSRTYGYTAGTVTIRNCVGLSNRSNELSGTATNPTAKWDIDGLYLQNTLATSYYMGLSGIKLKFKNVEFFGFSRSSTYGAIIISTLVSVDDFDNVLLDYNSVGIRLNPAATVVDAVLKGLIFNSIVANTTSDIYLVEPEFFCKNFVFDEPLGISNINTSGMGDSISGTQIGFVNYNGVANVDSTYYTNGTITRCGDGLGDTTVHTSGTGKFSMRFEPDGTENLLDWSQDVPTGNIQNKDMSVSIWVKINNANYYAGTNRLPRLTINYDNGTTAYAEAAQTTEWQKLFVPFTPLTTYGKITVKVDGYTDATGTDVYFYADDCAVAYPPGYALDLSGLDDWSNGLPVTPTISQVIADAGTLWDAETSKHTTTGTFGKKAADDLTKGAFLALK